MPALSEGLVVTLIGLGTVFVVLILLLLMLEGMKMLFSKKKTDDKNYNDEVVVKQENLSFSKQNEDILTQSSADSDIDEGELIAVLTAAVAATLKQSSYNLIVKSFRRVDQTSPVWNTTGRKEILDTKL